MENLYKIDDKKVRLKERFTGKEWGKVLKSLSQFAAFNAESAIDEINMSLNLSGNLLASGVMEDLISLIAVDENNKPVVIENIYEDEFDDAGRLIVSFFEMKFNLIKESLISLPGLNMKFRTATIN